MFDLEAQLSNIYGAIDSINAKLNDVSMSSVLKQMYSAQLKDLSDQSEKITAALDAEKAEALLSDPYRILELLEVVDFTHNYITMGIGNTPVTIAAKETLKIDIIKSLSSHHVHGVMGYIENPDSQASLDLVLKMNAENFNVQPPTSKDLSEFRDKFMAMISK